LETHSEDQDDILQDFNQNNWRTDQKLSDHLLEGMIEDVKEDPMIMQEI